MVISYKDKNAKEAIEEVSILTQHFGNPQRIIVDKGGALTSELHAVTTGIPRGNGQIERINRVLKAVFTKLTVYEPNTWYKHVRRVQHTINDTIQRAISTVPYELMFGTALKSPEDEEIAKLLKEARHEEFMSSRAALRDVAVRQIEKIQEENRRTYNARRKPSTKYNVGDIVAIKRTQFGPGLKLSIKFLGPYEVTEIQGKDEDGYDRYGLERIGEGDGPGKISSGTWPGHADDLESDDSDGEDRSLSDSGEEEQAGEV